MQTNVSMFSRTNKYKLNQFSMKSRLGLLLIGLGYKILGQYYFIMKERHVHSTICSFKGIIREFKRT